MLEKINYGGWANCLKLSNRECELIVTTDIGPRIIRFGFIEGQNFFYLSPEDSGKTGGNAWRIYGGHRLWIAPEALDRSYFPDNDPVRCSFQKDTLTLTQKREEGSGITKQMAITLSPDRNEAIVIHRLTNENDFDVQLSAWAISPLAPGGTAVVPQEPYGEGNDYLLPARSLALWQYTKMNDPRWIWGEKDIRAIQDPAIPSETKIGVLNKQGWAAYSLNDEVFLKRFSFDPEARYPDLGCNNEVYINGNFLEVETLGPLVTLPKNGKTEHTEHWLLKKGDIGEMV